jgi:hypothetical protein
MLEGLQQRTRLKPESRCYIVHKAGGIGLFQNCQPPLFIGSLLHGIVHIDHKNNGTSALTHTGSFPYDDSMQEL